MCTGDDQACTHLIPLAHRNTSSGITEDLLPPVLCIYHKTQTPQFENRNSLTSPLRPLPPPSQLTICSIWFSTTTTTTSITTPPLAGGVCIIQCLIRVDMWGLALGRGDKARGDGWGGGGPWTSPCLHSKRWCTQTRPPPHTHTPLFYSLPLFFSSTPLLQSLTDHTFLRV